LAVKYLTRGIWLSFAQKQRASLLLFLLLFIIFYININL